jgi:hypothetical protein
MYTRLLRKSVHTKKFTISHDQQGWEISEEEDSRLVLSVRYKDWHRVERAMQTFADKAKSLRQRGWADFLVTGTVERPTERPPERSSTAFLLPREPAHKF